MQVQAIQRQSQLVQVTPEPAQQGGFADQAAAFAGEQVQCFKRSRPLASQSSMTPAVQSKTVRTLRGL
ncbi:hypothetical protein AHiyo8_pI69200 (plasmid) [Arthrobacter sp. Hiyo8]|nr:hypothetical protein AHiyo8_pI69200 [Arthrobacter sp. Hiyo8]